MIVGVVGNQGAGKTALLAWLAAHYHSLGYKIHANFFLYGIPGLNPHFITSLKDIDRVRDGFSLFDEFWGFCADSRQSWSEVNQAVTDILSNARKREYNVIYEAKRASFVDVRIREQTDYFLHPCKKWCNPENGQLCEIQQNLLYPIDLNPWLDDIYIYVDVCQVEGGYERDLRQPFWFQLKPVTQTYNTKQEIRSILDGGMELSSGLQKGMVIENHFALRLREWMPDIVILQNGNSRGWDLWIDNMPLCFDSVSPHEKYGSYHFDVRGKRIKELTTEAAQHNKKGYFIWKLDDYYALEMTPAHIGRSSVACSQGVKLKSLILA